MVTTGVSEAALLAGTLGEAAGLAEMATDGEGLGYS
jgi:hypothetical protein